MEILKGHNAYKLVDKGGDGVLIVSSTIKGVQVLIKATERSRGGHLLLGLSVAEARELGTVSESLSDMVPSLEDAKRDHDNDQRQRQENYAKENPGASPLYTAPFTALAPIVHKLEVLDDKRSEFWGLREGPIEIPDSNTEYEKLGSLTWAADQLIFRFEDGDALLFRPETFRAIGETALNQPEFPPARSIWDRAK